ncbi:MAG: 3'-5' exonuclease [Clostridiales Family XIII bacterium]|jgi:DNA polymerase-3 subunit epsilon|nr:3'-5' exonuclease [Clostridiales Family XIII bacterium]
MDKLNFIAIDFETANNFRASACQVGLVKVMNSEIVDTFSSLICPPEEYQKLNYWNWKVHGIDAEDYLSAKSWLEIYEEHLADWLFGFDIMVAHNAPFDKGVWNALNDYYAINHKTQWHCTVKGVRRHLPNLPNHKLPTVAAHLGIEQLHHHDATDDALVCAHIALMLPML